MKIVSSGKTKGSHPHHRSKKKKKIKKKKYVKFPKRFEKQKQTVSEQLQDELEPIDFKEQADKEQKELDESMKESFRQRDERKAKERLKNEKV